MLAARRPSAHRAGDRPGAPLARLWPAPAAAAPPDVIAPKVLTVTMFQTGDPLTDGSGEASVWVKNDNLDQVVPIPGSYSPLYCNASYDHCLVITGVLAVQRRRLHHGRRPQRAGRSLPELRHGRRHRRRPARQDHHRHGRLGGLDRQRRPRHRARRPRDAGRLAVPEGLPRLRPAMVRGRLPHRHRGLSKWTPR